MTVLTLPQARIPLGWATVAGQRVPVVIDLEWMRYLVTLTERAGGITGVSTTELVESAYEDAGLEEVKIGLYALRDEFNQLPQVVEFVADESQCPQYAPAQFDDPLTPQIQFVTPDDPLPQIQALADQIAELVKEVQSLKQGLSA
jgi:hypothetical protein